MSDPEPSEFTALAARRSVAPLATPTSQRPASPASEPGGAGPSRAPPPAGAHPTVRARHLILLPTLNEEAGLEATLEELDSVPFRAPQAPPAVVVIDGRSTDGTRSVAARRGVVCLDQRSRGKGGAIREGLAWAREQGFSAVAVLDADGTYDAATLPAVFDLLDLGRDLVVGVRRTETSSRRTIRDRIHRVGNGLLNYTAAQFSRKPLLDICSGFWGVRTEALDRLDLESDGFEIESELFVKAFRRGLQTAQIPVAYRERVGAAKLHAVRDGSRILLSILRYSLRASPPRPVGGPDGTGPPAPRPLLNAVLHSLGPEHIILMSAADRWSEAEAVARRLTAAAPNATVVRATLPERRSSLTAGEILPPGLTEPAVGVGRTVVVTLPGRDRFTGDSGPTWIGIPRSGRVVHLPLRAEGARASRGSPPRLTGRFRRERLPHGPFAALSILSASLEPTWSRRELALLGANAAGFSIEVVRAGRAPRGVTRRARGAPAAARWSIRRASGG